MGKKTEKAREWFIPKMAPLLMVQLFVYGVVGLITFGVLFNKTVRPGLATFGIKIETPADRQAVQAEQVSNNTAKIKGLEERLTSIEGGVRALLEAVAPDMADLLPPIAKLPHAGS